MGARRVARESALQMLYLSDVAGVEGQDAVQAVWSAFKAPPAVQQFANDLALGTLRERNTIDTFIVKYTEHWELARMAAVDRNLLRLATFELLHQLETPVSVIIDEAIEIAKKFSTADSGKFVNGILDKIKLERAKGASGAVAKTERPSGEILGGGAGVGGVKPFG
ncbi:MAG: transcription antitermination factor NusB [Elusimicrobia bacterium]|nr:transcription antitermination factor NusB [Elusimicrobiota bacterium]